MRIAKSVLLITAVSAVWSYGTARGGAHLSDPQLIARDFAKAQASRTGSLLRYEAYGTEFTAGAVAADRSHPFRLKATCYRDGDRMDVQGIRWDDGKAVRGWRTILNGWYIAYDAPPRGKPAVQGEYGADGARFVGRVLPNGLSAFDGYVAGDLLNFTDVLKLASKVEVADDSFDGRQCLHVIAESDHYGHYEMWLDPSSDFYPRKVIVEKTGKNIWAGMPLDQWTKFSPHGSRGLVTLKSVTFTMDQAQLDQVDGHWFPLSCRITRIHNYSDGNSQTTVMDCKRTKLDLNPDFAAAKAFVPELRVGARLSNQPDPHLPYQWTTSGPAPLVDPKLVGDMDRTASLLTTELKR